MATTITETSVASQRTDTGITRKRLLDNERVKETRLLLERIALQAGAKVNFNLPAKSFAWLQMLEGEATFTAYHTDRISDTFSVLLPPGFPATLTTVKGASLIYAEIADAVPLDPGFLNHPPLFQVMDWMREPVFVCEYDARKRVSLVNPTICGSIAVRVDMVIYPAGSVAPKYQHVGADAFMYVVSGRGAGITNGGSFPAQQGDVIHFPDREWHYLKSANDTEIRFLEFCVPGEFKTVWADPSKTSAWQSTHRDLRNRETAQDEKERLVYQHWFGSPLRR